jgi:hypothetical protein
MRRISWWLSIVVVLCAAVMAKSGDSPLGGCMSPSEYNSLNPPYHIIVVHYRDIVSFDISMDGDTWAMMKDGRGHLWIYRDRRQMLSAPIAPGAQDGKMSYHFTVSRDFVASAVFQFNFGRHSGKIMLGDWAEINPQFNLSIELINATIQQGGVLNGEFRIACSSKYCLQFGSNCMWNYEISNARGEVVLRPEGECGDTLRQMTLEPGVIKSIPFAISTNVDESLDAGVTQDRFLPTGEYALTAYVEGHRDMHLEAVAKITVTP